MSVVDAATSVLEVELSVVRSPLALKENHQFPRAAAPVVDWPKSKLEALSPVLTEKFADSCGPGSLLGAFTWASLMNDMYLGEL